MNLESLFLNQLKEIFLKLRTITSQQRFFIFNLIDQNPNIFVNKLVEITKLEQPIVSQNLAMLRKAGFISSVQTNKQVAYSTNIEEIEKITTLAINASFSNISKSILVKTSTELIVQNFQLLNELHQKLKIILKDNRLQILSILMENKEICVNEIADATHQKQPITSQNLQILKQIQIIKEIKKGRQVWYSIEENNFKKLEGAVIEYFLTR